MGLLCGILLSLISVFSLATSCAGWRTRSCTCVFSLATSCAGWRTGSCTCVCGLLPVVGGEPDHVATCVCGLLPVLGGEPDHVATCVCGLLPVLGGEPDHVASYVMQTFLLRDHARYYAQTVNILKFRKFFVHFKSYLLKFRRQYELLCCLLAKIRAFLRNWRVPYGKWHCSRGVYRH